MSLRIVPISLDAANDYIDRLHRHNDPLPGHKFSIGVEDGDGVLRGVALIGLGALVRWAWQMVASWF